jgi:hypothetical protein
MESDVEIEEIELDFVDMQLTLWGFSEYIPIFKSKHTVFCTLNNILAIKCVLFSKTI